MLYVFMLLLCARFQVSASPTTGFNKSSKVTDPPFAMSIKPSSSFVTTHLASHFGRGSALRRARFHHDADPIPGSQCYRRKGHNRMLGDKPEPELLRDRRDRQRRFHQREGVADALPRPASKREVGKFWIPFEQVALPPLGTKFVGRVIPSRVAMHGPLCKRNTRAFGYRVPCNFVVLNGCPSGSPGGREEPHRLRDDVIRINELWQIVERRRAPGEHRS